MSVYDKLVQIAADKAPLGYLAHYRDDLFKHDRNTLEGTNARAGAKTGDRYLWTLRSCGTGLFPIASGHDPVWATYWLHQGNAREAPSLVFLVTIATGKVEPISYDRAERLANEPHPQGKRVTFSLAAA